MIAKLLWTRTQSLLCPLPTAPDHRTYSSKSNQHLQTFLGPHLFTWKPPETPVIASHMETHICNSYTPTIHHPRTSQFATAILTLPYGPQESLHLPSHFLQDILTHTHDLHQISYALSLSHRYTHTRLSSPMGPAPHTHATLHTQSAP